MISAGNRTCRMSPEISTLTHLGLAPANPRSTVSLLFYLCDFLSVYALGSEFDLFSLGPVYQASRIQQSKSFQSALYLWLLPCQFSLPRLCHDLKQKVKIFISEMIYIPSRNRGKTEERD
jgi:hypothetical protein